MKTISEACHVYQASNVADNLIQLLKNRDPRQTYLLTDKGSTQHCLGSLTPLFEQGTLLKENHIEIEDGDESKDYTSALSIWEFLSSHGATRKSLLICLGGGMPCDLGGFCASTFKRGIEFINIPTTLLSQVDASLGGKTGMNLGSLKNEIGTFSKASHVLISGLFLRSLDKANLLSGFAEMLKHSLIHDASQLDELLALDFDNVNYSHLEDLVARSIMIKDHFVTIDPTERGMRKALNFGHTFGHAIETWGMRNNRPMLHGFAVAYGMVCELMLSRDVVGLDANKALTVGRKILALYGMPTSIDAPTAELMELMHHDKKNDGAQINFTLLPEVGEVLVNQTADENHLARILDEFRNLCREVC